MRRRPRRDHPLALARRADDLLVEGRACQGQRLVFPSHLGEPVSRLRVLHGDQQVAVALTNARVDARARVVAVLRRLLLVMRVEVQLLFVVDDGVPREEPPK